MPSAKPEVPQPAPVVQPSIWSDIKTTLRSLFGTVVAISRTSEKAVKLVENEIDNLDLIQQIRLDLSRAERILQQKTLEDADLALPPA